MPVCVQWSLNMPVCVQCSLNMPVCVQWSLNMPVCVQWSHCANTATHDELIVSVPAIIKQYRTTGEILYKWYWMCNMFLPMNVHCVISVQYICNIFDIHGECVSCIH